MGAGRSTQEITFLGTSLVVQWLRLRTPNAGGLGSIPGQGTRSHMPQLKSLHATTKDPTCLNKDPACCNEDPRQPNKLINQKKKKERTLLFLTSHQKVNKGKPVNKFKLLFYSANHVQAIPCSMDPQIPYNRGPNSQRPHQHSTDLLIVGSWLLWFCFVFKEAIGNIPSWRKKKLKSFHNDNFSTSKPC